MAGLACAPQSGWGAVGAPPLPQSSAVGLCVPSWPAPDKSSVDWADAVQHACTMGTNSTDILPIRLNWSCMTDQMPCLAAVRQSHPFLDSLSRFWSWVLLGFAEFGLALSMNCLYKKCSHCVWVPALPPCEVHGGHWRKLLRSKSETALQHIPDSISGRQSAFVCAAHLAAETHGLKSTAGTCGDVRRGHIWSQTCCRQQCLLIPGPRLQLSWHL